MNDEKDREIIRLWNRLRALEKQGEPTLAARVEIRAALAERDHGTSVAVQKSACARSFRNRVDARPGRHTG